MEKIALYRKYRPIDFTSIYGQKSVVQTLLNSIKHKSINHAYIFAGNKGSGKTSIAKIFSKAINCLDLNEGNPCNTCENCQAINNNMCMDIVELDAASNSGINEIKNIIESIIFMPSQLKHKVYIIDEAHMLTNNSWNALLKTLEEPPIHAVLIFATTEYHKIPSTIVSRCQRYDFNKIPRHLLTELISNIADKENIKIDNDSMNAIASLANGAARDALSILDQLINYSNNDININIINEMFGLIDINTKIKYVNAILNHKVEDIVQMIDYFSQKAINFNILTNELIQMMMDKIIYISTSNLSLLQILNESTVELINTKETSLLLKLIGIYNENANKLKNTEHPKFIFEYISILACNFNMTINDDVKANKSLDLDKPTNNENKFNRDNIKPNQAKVLNDTVEQSTLEIPFINDDLFSTSSRLVLKPVENTENVEQENLFGDENNIIKETKNLVEESTPNEPTKSSDEYVIRSKNDIPIELENIYGDVYKNIFFAIAANHDKNKKDKFNQVLSSFKETPIIDNPSLNAFLNAEKFLITSENGCVLLFNEEAQVIRFNKISTTEVFKEFFEELFKCEQLVIGVYKLQALGLKNEYQNLAKKEFKDVKINNILKDAKKTMLLDILNLKDDINNDGDAN